MFKNKMKKDKIKKKSQENGITFGMVMVVFMSVAIVLIVNYMKQEVSALKAEQVMLQRSVEALKFKNRVTDTIFAIQEE